MPRPRKEIPADQARMLAYVLACAPGPRTPAAVSVSDMAEALGCSAGKVKSLRRSLVDEGLLEVEERRLPNGAQAENSYRVTRTGRRRLESHADVKVSAS